jgi:FlaA1/EpsC-like NDP-sugar epimerase
MMPATPASRRANPFQKVSRILRRLANALDGGHISGRELTAANELAGFLKRPAICLPSEPVHGLVGGRRVLVTGAGGTIGSELCRQIASCDPASLVMVDRYENGLHAVALDLAGRVGMQPVVGDITDPQRLDDIVSGARPEIVLHAAAHKHVPLMERNPCEAMKNNIIGTRMVVDAAIRCRAARFVLISTDKAVRPSSVMGATKRAAELIVQRAARDSQTRCAIVRFGNVLGSNGSVFHTFRSQVRAGGPVTVTHPDVRRFFMLVHEAVQLVLHAAAAAPQGAIAVLDIGNQIPIVELAHYVIRLAGLTPNVDVPIVFTGLRPGEKLDEELVGEGEHLIPSKVDGIGWVAAPERHDWLAFTRHLGVLESLAFEGVADDARLALNRLLEPFGGVHASAALHPAQYAAATAS